MLLEFNSFSTISIAAVCSVNVPLDELVDRIEELKEMQPMVMCCESGNRSGQAVSYLSSNGFEKVYNGGGWMSVDLQRS